jgi:diguanylate cyclase (GGDEF)-like protein
MRFSSWIKLGAAALAGAAVGRLSAAHRVRLLRAAVTHLTQLAHRDPLTGLLNRTGLERAYHHAASAPRCVILVDLDAFKLANDQHGHPAGDRVLAAFGQRLHSLASAVGGAAGRLGGDEFALILPSVGRELAEVTAAAATAAVVFPALPTGPLSVTGSAGLAFVPAGYPWTRALTDADIALYRSKRTGFPVSFQHGMTYPVLPRPRRRARDATDR